MGRESTRNLWGITQHRKLELTKGLAVGMQTKLGYGSETGTAAELRLALTITLTLTDTGFAVLTLMLGYTRRSPDPIARI